LVEFADFKCPHCRTAWATLKRFKEQMPDATVIFKPFPLDGSCNPSMQQKGDNSRCKMAGWVLCAEKISQKGWLVHDYLFENQERLFPVYGDELDKDLKEFAGKNGINADEVSMCSQSSDTAILIGKMVEEAKAAQVQGTPTIYLNNRRLEAAQIFDVLKNAYNSLN
jgi:protein-disulfide isomerase